MSIYCDPEAFGLTTVGEIDWTDADYEFDLTAAWVDASGHYYWADDSGCSCPTPFEDITSLSDLQSGSLDALLAHLRRTAQQRGIFRADRISNLATRQLTQGTT